MRKKYKRSRKVKHTAAIQAIAVSLAFVFLFFLCSRKINASVFFLSESLPGASELFREDKAMYKFADGVTDMPESQTAYKNNEDSALIYMPDLVGVNDVDLQPETDSEAALPVKQEAVSFGDIDKLRDLSYLSSNFYTVDKATALTAHDFNVDDMLNADLKLDMSQPGPKVLIFHTHSQEMYANSDHSSLMDGVVGVGNKLSEILTNVYGIETLHDTGEYDVVNGEEVRGGAYERMEPAIEKILKEHPSIQAAIDLHRDGVSDGVRLVTDINGVPTAQIMFDNGLCLQNKSGKLIPYQLQNPFLQENLAFSFQSQLTANSLYPSFTRRIYLNAWRYSLNMLPKSLLVEVGAQTNTKEEAFNAMGPLAAVLSQVLQ